MEYDALLEEKSKNRDEFEGNVIRKYLADMYEMSDSKMQRYLAISKLIPELMDCLDINKINISVASILASIDNEFQKIIYEWIIRFQDKISIKTARIMKDCVLEGKEFIFEKVNENDIKKRKRISS